MCRDRVTGENASQVNGILFTVRAVYGNTIQWALAEKQQSDQKEEG